MLAQTIKGWLLLVKAPARDAGNHRLELPRPLRIGSEPLCVEHLDLASRRQLAHLDVLEPCLHRNELLLGHVEQQFARGRAADQCTRKLVVVGNEHLRRRTKGEGPGREDR
eukprot:459285-Prymnesium_polylepis.1